MTQTDIRITELMTRLTALERERATIMAEIEILQSAPSEQTAAIKVISVEFANRSLAARQLHGDAPERTARETADLIRAMRRQGWSCEQIDEALAGHA